MWHSARTMSGEQSPEREDMSTDGAASLTSVSPMTVCFLAESCLGPEMAPCSVQPVLGYASTVLESNFLQELLGCEGDSERTEEGKK